MSDTRERMVDYLAAHNTLTLATEKDGQTFACSLFYVNDGLNLYFVSDPNTQHAENIAQHHQVSATVHEDYRDWRTIQGIQLGGDCSLIHNPIESAKALALYANKFPFVAQLAAAMAKVKFYKITPRWMRLVDNTRGFGFKEEIEL
jgi:uncharacterized protein